MGSTLGVVLAAFVLTVAPELLRSFAEYRVLLFGVLMVAMMIWRPRGLVRISRASFAERKGWRHERRHFAGGTPDDALWRHQGVERSQSGGGARLHHRPDWPQWRRQDHGIQLPDRLLPRQRRRDLAQYPQAADRRDPVLGQKFRAGDWIRPKRLGSRLYYKMFGGTHLVNRAGLARTFQNIRLFREMSVVENLLVAQHMQSNRNLIAGVLNTPGYRRAESAALDHAFYWLEVVDLVDCANRLAGEMSYGQQRRLEIARAMCTAPEMICLDEPAAGLNPVETATLSRIIRFLRQHHGITVLLIEHDMGMVMEISDRVIVLDHGDVIARGTPQEIQHNEAVIAAYPGADEEELAG